MGGTESLHIGGQPIDGLRHIALLGKPGSGKTTIFHSLIKKPAKELTLEGSDLGICDLGRNGKVVLLDTDSIKNSIDELSNESNEKLYETLSNSDIAIYNVDIQHFDRKAYEQDAKWLDEHNIPYILIFNKCDLAYTGDIAKLKMEYPKALFLSFRAPDAIALLRTHMGNMMRVIKSRHMKKAQ